MEALNLRRDEVNRLSEALKDETFLQLLSDYVTEISDPDNKRQYEDDIKQLEADRGMQVQFIHPKPHHVLKTRNSDRKCFINLCSDPLIDKASCESARDRDGKSGQNWTLPFSVTPGRADRDTKGHPCIIYDVIFHPDTLHLSEKDSRFMNLIISTAVKGIEDSFNLHLDSCKVKLIKSKYKGVPHPAVIRKAIPGFIKQDICEDQLSFPYPDVPSSAGPNKSPDKTSSSLCEQPIKPHYTLKYRSVIDLQNYSNSRFSALSDRPKDIIIIIDLPLITSAHDVDVSIIEKRLVLETQKPSYKLELPLSFPVDEDKGDAKFNKTTKQLTVTLPVLPLKNTESPPMTCNVDDDEDDLESDDEARLASHQENEKLCETRLTRFHCDISTQFSSDRCEQINVAAQSVCNCYVGEMKTFNSPFIKEVNTNDPSNNVMMTSTESRGETDHFCKTHGPEMNLDDEENEFKVNIHPQEMFSSNSHSTPDKEHVEVCYISERRQTTTLDVTAAFIHEPLMSHDTEQLNLFATHEKETCDLTEPVSQKPETKEEPNTALNPRTDVSGDQSMEPADVDNYSKSYPEILREKHSDGSEVNICKHKTTAALCYQNSLWFDLD